MAPNDIALFLANESNDYQQTVKADALSAAARAGMNLRVYSADERVTQQIKQLYELLHTDPSKRPSAVIVMTARVNALDPIARALVQAGIGWIALNRKMDSLAGLRQEFPDVPICFVSPDQREIGEIQGRQFRALLPKGGQILYVQGEATSSPAQERLAGMRESTRGKGFDLAGVLDGNWNPDDAERVVGNFLRMVMPGKSQIDLVGCQSDAMAIGAGRALKSVSDYLKRPDLLRIPVTGCDGVPTVGQEMVNRGKLAATVIIPSVGGPAVELVVRAVRNGERLPPEVKLSPMSFPAEETLVAQAGKRR